MQIFGYLRNSLCHNPGTNIRFTISRATCLPPFAPQAHCSLISRCKPPGNPSTVLPPETSIAPQKQGLEDEFPFLGKASLRVLCYFQILQAAELMPTGYNSVVSLNLYLRPAVAPVWCLQMWSLNPRCSNRRGRLRRWDAWDFQPPDMWYHRGRRYYPEHRTLPNPNGIQMNPMHWSLHAIHNAEMAALGHTRQSQTQDAIKVKGSKGLRRLVGGSNEFHVGTQVTDTNVVFQENACDPWRKTSAREDICNVQISVTVCTGASSLQCLSKFCIRMYSKKK